LADGTSQFEFDTLLAALLRGEPTRGPGGFAVVAWGRGFEAGVGGGQHAIVGGIAAGFFLGAAGVADGLSQAQNTGSQEKARRKERTLDEYNLRIEWNYSASNSNG